MKNRQPFFSSEWIQLSFVVTLFTVITLPSYFFGQDFMYLNHDRNVHPIRLWHVENALYEGVLMPNWLSTFTNNMGSPVFLLNWFLPYYLAIIPRLIGFNLADSIKLVFLFSYVFSGYSFYLLAKLFLERKYALAATLFSLILPYRYTLIFVRGALGEAVGLSLMPVVLYFFIHTKSKLSLIGTTVSLSLLIVTHNVLALYAVVMASLWLGLHSRTLADYRRSIWGGVFALLITCFFWLPALIEKNYTHIQTALDWSLEHFVPLAYLFAFPARASTGLPHDLPYGMTLNLGVFVCLLILAGLVSIVRRKVYSKQEIYLGLLFFIAILIQLPQSQPLWMTIPLLRLSVFPWRIHSVLMIVLPLLAGISLTYLPKKLSSATFILVVFAQLGWQQIWQPLTAYLPEKTYLPIWHDGSSEGEFLPLTADRQEYIDWYYVAEPDEELWMSTQEYRFIQTKQQATNLSATIEATTKTHVVVNHYYFPGWFGQIDGKPITISDNLEKYKGRINFELSQGKHLLELQFKPTPIRVASRLVSLISLICLIAYYGVTNKRKLVRNYG
jgi:hypothetical protein